MVEIKLIDRSFIMCGPSCGTGQTGKAPKKLKWYIGPEDRDITVLTDMCINQVDSCNSKIKIAWLIEPRAISPQTYQFIQQPQVYNKFNYILTHDRNLLNINNEKFYFCPLAGHWIDEEDIKVHKKSKDLSIIASAKMNTNGQKLRHDIVKNFHIDGIFGRGYQQVDKKIEGLKDYRFHIVVENDRKDYWFTEKLIDCFATGTVPIYWGCQSIEAFFNPSGIIIFKKLEDLRNILNNANKNLYNKMLPAIKENLEISKNYFYPEDFMYESLIKYLI